MYSPNCKIIRTLYNIVQIWSTIPIQWTLSLNSGYVFIANNIVKWNFSLTASLSKQSLVADISTAFNFLRVRVNSYLSEPKQILLLASFSKQWVRKIKCAKQICISVKQFYKLYFFLKGSVLFLDLLGYHQREENMILKIA